MACQIQINVVVPYGGPGQLLTALKVSGTAQGCSGVYVKVDCGAQTKELGTNAPPGTPPTATWNWEVMFTDLSGTDCGCDTQNSSAPHQLVVVAYCKADPTCSDRFTLSPIICADCCPSFDVEWDVKKCNDEGLRPVAFEVHTTPPGGSGCPPQIVAQMDFGDGAYGQAFTVPPDYDWHETHLYAPGSYTVKVKTSLPTGCKDFEKRLTVTECGGNGNGNGHGGHPCWWCPWFCLALLGLALLSMVVFLGALIFSCLASNPLWVAVGYKIAVIAALLGLAFLIGWAAFCSKTDPDFCKTLDKLLLLLHWVLIAQTWILIILGLLALSSQNWSCLLGLIVNYAYYAAIKEHLQELKAHVC